MNDTAVGPLVNEHHLKGLFSPSRKRGLRARGRSSAASRRGLVLPRHVFVDATNDMSRPGGTVVSIIKVQDEDEALAVAIATSYGLSAAVVTRDLKCGARLARRLPAGMTHVNGFGGQ
jgi:aldehyde dehydrogenase (NAD+)